MKALHLVLLAITCFCTIDFVLIQSGIFVQCKPVHDVYGAENLAECEQTAEHIQQLFGFAASIGIAFIVGIVTMISRKKGVIFALSLVGLTASEIVTYQIMLMSTITPPGMHPMSISDVIFMDYIRAPLWVYLFGAAILGSIVCVIVAFGNKIVKIK